MNTLNHLSHITEHEVFVKRIHALPKLTITRTDKFSSMNKTRLNNLPQKSIRVEKENFNEPPMYIAKSNTKNYPSKHHVPNLQLHPQRYHRIVYIS